MFAIVCDLNSMGGIPLMLFPTKKEAKDKLEEFEKAFKNLDRDSEEEEKVFAEFFTIRKKAYFGCGGPCGYGVAELKLGEPILFSFSLD